MTLLYGHQSEEIRVVQKALIAHGFDVGPAGADGGFGNATLAAVRNARDAFKLTPGDTIDEALLAALGLSNSELYPSTQPKGTIMGNIFSGILGNLLNWQLIQGYLRNALLTVGGSLVTDGLLTSAELNTVVGAIVIVAGIVFSAVSNNRKLNAVQVVKAVEAHPDITVVPAADTALGKPIVSVAK